MGDAPPPSIEIALDCELWPESMPLPEDAEPWDSDSEEPDPEDDPELPPASDPVEPDPEEESLPDSWSVDPSAPEPSDEPDPLDDPESPAEP